MSDGIVTTLIALLASAIPIGLILAQHWAGSRFSGKVRLDQETKSEIEPALQPENTPRP